MKEYSVAHGRVANAPPESSDGHSAIMQNCI